MYIHICIMYVLQLKVLIYISCIVLMFTVNCERFVTVKQRQRVKKSVTKFLLSVKKSVFLGFGVL